MTDGILTTRDDLNSFARSCYGIMFMQLDFVCNDKVFLYPGRTSSPLSPYLNDTLTSAPFSRSHIEETRQEAD